MTGRSASPAYGPYGTPAQGGIYVPSNPSNTQSNSIAKAAVQNAKWLVNNANRVFYKSAGNSYRTCSTYLSSPCTLQNLGEPRSIITDCSGSIFLCYVWAGIEGYLSQPQKRSRITVNGNSFVPIDKFREWKSSNSFYTGTIESYFVKVGGLNTKSAMPGDILLWNNHAALIVQTSSTGNYIYFNHGGPGYTDRPHMKTEIKSGFKGVYRWPGLTRG